MLDDIENWISTRLPSGSACRVARIADHTDALLPTETDAIAKAIPRRRAEFATGRILARDCLAQISETPVAIPVGMRRQPAWPDHLTGSITHIGDLCAVALAPLSSCRSIGLDLAICADVDARISERTSTSAELERNGSDVPGNCLHACLFSIRESIFKAYYPSTASELDFADVTLDLNGSTGQFVADIINDERPDLFGQRRISGHFAVFDGYAITIVVVP